MREALSCALPRRGLVGGALAGLATGLGVHAAAAPRPPRGLIDVHHHPIPESFLAASRVTPGQRAILSGWSAQKTIDQMDAGGVATAILSMPADVEVWVDDPAKAAGRARDWNEFLARLAGDHRGRFASWAILPTPFPDLALAELAYALDILGARGVCITTNVGDRWLGDPHYAPLLDELDRRRAIVFVHPGVAGCCRGLLPDITDATIELPTDTTRAITRLIFSGAADRYRNIRFIFSHGGGTMPFIIGRLIRAPKVNPKLAERVPDGVVTAVRRFYYDTALAAHPYAMAPLRRLVGASQILFGTDYPFATGAETFAGLADCGFDVAELAAVGSGNVRRLLPDL